MLRVRVSESENGKALRNMEGDRERRDGRRERGRERGERGRDR